MISKNKMSKKAQKEENSKKRVMWTINPITRKTKNKKAYNRKAFKSVLD